MLHKICCLSYESWYADSSSNVYVGILTRCRKAGKKIGFGLHVKEARKGEKLISMGIAFQAHESTFTKLGSESGSVKGYLLLERRA